MSQGRRKMFGDRGAGIEAAQRVIVFLRKARKKILALFFNCEETALIASTCVEGHALTSCILLLLVAVAVAVAAVTAISHPWRPKQ